MQSAADETGTPMYLGGRDDGWQSAYPQRELLAAMPPEELFERLAAKHAVLVDLADSDVFQYVYARDGKVVDEYNSCPDYYGECDQAALDAVGHPPVFADLLGPEKVQQLAALLAPRMVNGEEVNGPTPVFEDERVAEFGRIVGLPGVLGSCEGIEAEETGENTPNPADLVRVG
jgi:hypothetical protein